MGISEAVATSSFFCKQKKYVSLVIQELPQRFEFLFIVCLPFHQELFFLFWVTLEIISPNDSLHSTCKNVTIAFNTCEDGAWVVSDGFNALCFFDFVEWIFFDLPDFESWVFTCTYNLFKLIVVVEKYCISYTIVMTLKCSDNLVCNFLFNALWISWFSLHFAQTCINLKITQVESLSFLLDEDEWVKWFKKGYFGDPFWYPPKAQVCLNYRAFLISF